MRCVAPSLRRTNLRPLVEWRPGGRRGPGRPPLVRAPLGIPPGRLMEREMRGAGVGVYVTGQKMCCGCCWLREPALGRDRCNRRTSVPSRHAARHPVHRVGNEPLHVGVGPPMGRAIPGVGHFGHTGHRCVPAQRIKLAGPRHTPHASRTRDARRRCQLTCARSFIAV